MIIKSQHQITLSNGEFNSLIVMLGNLSRSKGKDLGLTDTQITCLNYMYYELEANRTAIKMDVEE
jgi:hypothetical protein